MHLEDLLFGTFVYLTAAVIAAPIAMRLGLGSVLGYLVAGIVIGPSVAGFIGGGEGVMHFAEFGEYNFYQRSWTDSCVRHGRGRNRNEHRHWRRRFVCDL